MVVRRRNPNSFLMRGQVVPCEEIVTWWDEEALSFVDTAWREK